MMLSGFGGLMRNLIDLMIEVEEELSRIYGELSLNVDEPIVKAALRLISSDSTKHAVVLRLIREELVSGVERRGSGGFEGIRGKVAELEEALRRLRGMSPTTLNILSELESYESTALNMFKYILDNYRLAIGNSPSLSGELALIEVLIKGIIDDEELHRMLVEKMSSMRDIGH